MKFYLRMIPMLSVMGIIFLISNKPADEFTIPAIPHLDKIGHFFIYGLLAFTMLLVPSSEIRKKQWLLCAVIIPILTLLYGISDEYHQSFIPGRVMSGSDLVADFAGGVAAVGVWLTVYRSRRN